ncbi:MAG TPA: CheR family methyltransferase [Vicinamibacterales bacterium]|nr:CheR family methyltransferase [Vicinamibacterales bacterium]
MKRGTTPLDGIAATTFFHDRLSLEQLGTRVLAALVHEGTRETPIRIWIPGCSTGEDAYSLAIVLAEQMAAARSACPVQIFATDADDDAVKVARTGTYPDSIARDITPERLQRFFTRHDHRYTIAKSIRGSIVFAVQNLVSDPPFSKLDLVSCRNVLTHLEPEMQAKLLSIFHFALNPGGHLCLGGSAGVDPPAGPFETVSKRWRIFRRAQVSHVNLVRLEAELRAAKKERRELVEQVESSNEELKAANDEVVWMNEELQSTNTELTTSNEELQSMADELSALNAQLQDKVEELTAVNDDLASLLVSTDIATLVLDTGLRIKRCTAAAAHIFDVRQSDIGRPMSDFASTLIDIDLSRDARTVLDSGVPFEERVAARDGRRYFLRILPYRRGDKTVQGVVLTLVDVTTVEQAEHDLRGAREQAAQDLRRMTRLHELSIQLAGAADSDTLQNVIRAAVDVTAAHMGHVQRCDQPGVLSIAAQIGFERPFLDFFARVDSHTHSACTAAMVGHRRILVDDVETSTIFAGAASLAIMQAAGVRALQSTPLYDRSGGFLGTLSTHYRHVHHFGEAELRWLDLLARHAADVIDRQRTGELLARSQRDLETRIAERTRWLSLMHDVAVAINEATTWDDALHQVLRRLCHTENWQIGFVYLPDPRQPETIVPVVSCFGDERFRSFHDLSMQHTYTRGDRLPGRVYAENKPFWAPDTEALMAAIPMRAVTATSAGLRAGVALPVAVREEVIAVLELFSAHRHPPNEQLATLMQDVGDQVGRVLERERATARMADLVWREQQDLLHTLHDSLGQTLTGVGMLSTSLCQRLAAADAETAETAAEIARQTQQALGHVRLLAKNLFPVEVEAESLTVALRDLAAATRSLHKIDVRVAGEPPKGLHDGKIATELYRIAQEAVTNSVKHAQAKTVTIRLEGVNSLTRLQIADDGIGIPRPEPGDGAGLRIMRYRATSIGASLSVERGATGGTVVTCTLVEPPMSARNTV